MKTYTVTWVIDLYADSHADAAKKALEIQRDKNSWATFFEVRDENDVTKKIDLGTPA